MNSTDHAHEHGSAPTEDNCGCTDDGVSEVAVARDGGWHRAVRRAKWLSWLSLGWQPNTPETGRAAE